MTSGRNTEAGNFEIAKDEVESILDTILDSLGKASGNLEIIASVLPGQQPLNVEIALISKALRQARQLKGSDGIDRLLRIHSASIMEAGRNS